MNKSKSLVVLPLYVLSFFIALTARAQFPENFNHGGAMPTGWTLIGDGHTVSTSFTSSTALHADLTANAWYPFEALGIPGDYQMITTSLFTPAAAANRWLITPSFLVPTDSTVLTWQDYDLASGESINVKISPTAGITTSSFTDIVYSGPAAPDSLTTHYALIGAYHGTNITVAFRDSTYNNWGLVIDNVNITTRAHYDLRVSSINLPLWVATGSTNTINGILTNYGVNTINTAHINYKVTGGAAVSSSLSGLTIPLGSSYTYTCATPWVPAAAGMYNIKAWVDNMNGANADVVNAALDTFYTSVQVIDTIVAKTVMMEDFTNASSDPDAVANPNVDSVFNNNSGRAELARFHVNFPGRDCMDTVTLTPFVNYRMAFNNIAGIPYIWVDGSSVYAGTTSFNTPLVSAAASKGSPLKISVVPSYNATTNAYSFTATVKSYANLPSGLIAYAVLTVDTLTYHSNQSTESIPQNIFYQVAENMFPSGGTMLSSFTTGATQTITGSWAKNHPWGSDYSVWSYDSSQHGRIVVWVEDTAQKLVYQASGASVSMVVSTTGLITGTTSLCVSGTSALTDATAGGTWSSSNTSVATISTTGLVTGVSAGTSVITYNLSGSIATTNVTVAPLPTVSAVTGLSSLCASGIISVSDATAGGVWSSSNTSVATVSTSGLVSGIAGGTSIISYTVSNACGSTSATHVVTVNPLPSVAPVTGLSDVCLSSTILLSDATSGGVWTSSATGIATISSAGLVSGIASGTTIISYTATNTCGSTAATYVVTVSLLPSAGTITGSSSVCAAGTLPLSDAAPGGVWTSSATSAATVSASGLVTGVAGGTTTISYTVTNACGTAITTHIITVNPLPVVGTISGLSTMCSGNTTTLSDATGSGSWSSTAPGVAAVSSSGVVSGIAIGTTTISYTVTNSCGSTAATINVTVSGLPDAGTISGPDTVCISTSVSMTNTTGGGAWSTALGHASVSSGGAVTGVTAGMDTVEYTTTNSCGSSTTKKLILVSSCITDVKEATAVSNSITIYPNPTEAEATIVSSAAIHHIAVTNMIGERMFTGNYSSSQVTIDMRAYPPGIYLVKINNTTVLKLTRQ